MATDRISTSSMSVAAMPRGMPRLTIACLSGHVPMTMKPPKAIARPKGSKTRITPYSNSASSSKTAALSASMAVCVWRVGVGPGDSAFGMVCSCNHTKAQSDPLGKAARGLQARAPPMALRLMGAAPPARLWRALTLSSCDEIANSISISACSTRSISESSSRCCKTNSAA